MRLVLAAALLTLTAITTPTAAAVGAEPWGTDLRYHPVRWLDTEHPELASYAIDAPQGWTLTQPNHSTGVFTDPTGTRTERMDTMTGEYTVRGVLGRIVVRLEAAGEEILFTRVRTTDVGRLGTVASRHDSTLTRTRVVGYETRQGGVWSAYYLVTVSGGTDDGPGLRAILRHVTPAVFSTP